MLDIKNKCLLSKWLFKILHEEGVWHELISNKYLGTKTLAQVEMKPHDSPFWKGVMKVRDEFFKRGSFALGDGLGTRFWEDTWLGTEPLATQYPLLYNIARRKNVLVAHVLQHNPLNIEFRRPLLGDKWNAWLQLVERLMGIHLTDETDKFVWNLTPNGRFYVKSMYLDCMHGHAPFLHKYLWKLKVPLKIKIFMWFLHRKVLLTKDNLIKRQWNGCKQCVFCQSEETVEHLFISCSFTKNIWRLIHFTFNIPAPTSIDNLFSNWLCGVDKKTKARIRIGICAFVWAIWNCRNDVVFNKVGVTHFLQVVHKALYWIHMWSFLLSEDQRALLDTGCTRLLAVVRATLAQGGWLHTRRLQNV